MKRAFSALLLASLLFFGFASGGKNVISSPYFLSGDKAFFYSPPNDLTEFEGTWVFEKAEYMERSSFTDDFHVKYVIEKPEALEAFTKCLSQAVKRITFGDAVYVDCPFETFCGRPVIVTVHTPKGERKRLTVGDDPDAIGKDSSIPGVIYNVAGLTYWIEKTDNETIAMTLEAICFENGVETNAAIKCFLKKLPINH